MVREKVDDYSGEGEYRRKQKKSMATMEQPGL